MYKNKLIHGEYQSTSFFFKDFYCTPKLTGAVHFEPSNGPSGLVLHGRLTEYESEIPGEPVEYLDRRGKMVIRSGADIILPGLGVFLSF
jgi:hypothetical protein